jgi:hypothetical protein
MPAPVSGCLHAVGLPLTVVGSAWGALGLALTGV